MSLTRSEFVRFLGDTATLALTLRDPDSDAVFDRTGWNLIFTMKKTEIDADAVAIVQKSSAVGGFTDVDVANGRVDLQLVPADAAAIEVGRSYQVDVQAQNATTGAIKTVMRGSFRTEARITLGTVISIPTTTTNPGVGYSWANISDKPTWVVPFAAFAVSQQLFVSKAGLDTNPGSPLQPFLTVSAAMAAITDSGINKWYAIFVGPGSYDEAALALKPGVWVIGCGNIAGGGCRINITGGAHMVTADPTFNTGAAGVRGGFHNIYFRGTTGLNFDLTGFGVQPTILELINCAFNGAVTYKAHSNGDGLYWIGGITFGALTIQGGGSVNLTNVIAAGVVTLRDGTTGVVGSITVQNCLFYGNVAVSSNDAANSTSVLIAASSLNGTLTTTRTAGACSLTIDAVSSASTAIVNVGGATIILSTPAFGIKYTPTTAGDWPIVPTTVQAALDALASRISGLGVADIAGLAAALGAKADALVALSDHVASYSLVLADAFKDVGMNVAGANTLTVPANADVAFAIGTTIIVEQVGAGQTTIAAAVGVTINSRGGALKLAGQFASALLIKRAVNTWSLSGDITA